MIYTFGELLKQFRVREGMSQQQLADHLKEVRPTMHRNSISAWERGAYLPDSLEIVQRVAEALHLGEHDTQQLLEATREKITLKHLWNIPHQRNPFFTGRKAMLQSLHELLLSGRTAVLTQPQALSGLGGIGKTQTAVEYAHRYHHEYQAVLWIRADSRETVLADFASLADLLHLTEKSEQDLNLVKEAVKHWLSTHTGWLLVLDNIEDLDLVEEFLPTRHEGHVFLTTRAHITEPVALATELPKMKRDEGAFFLLRRAKMIPLDAPLSSASRPDLTQARNISVLMDGLPLALDQAGAYVLETRCGLSHYVDLYQERRADLLKLRGSFASGHPDSVSTTFSLSLERVEQVNGAAVELLRLCAFLHPDAIPEEILTEGASELGPVLQSVTVDRLALDQALGALLRFSLISRDPKTNTLSVHRLVQAVLQDGMDQQTFHQWAERAVRAVNKAFPRASAEFSTWQQCQRCLPHALACAALITQWNMRSEEAAQLLDHTGDYLRERAQYAQVAPLCNLSLAIREQMLGPEHPAVAQSLNTLGRLYVDQSKYTEAEPLYQRALTILEKSPGSEPADVATTLNNLAELYRHQSKFAEAEQLYLRAINIRERSLGPQHPDLARTLNNLGLLYHIQDKFAEAEPYYQRVLAILKQTLEPGDPDIGQGLHNLAALYDKQDKYAEAEPLYQESLAILEQALGPQHPYVAICLNNLATLYYTLGKYNQAEPLVKRAVMIAEQAVGQDSFDAGLHLSNLGKIFLTQGKYAEAKSLLEQALTILKQTVGKENDYYASTLSTLAKLYIDQNKGAQAEPLLKAALATLEQAFGPEHPNTIFILYYLAELYGMQEKYAEAEALLKQALNINEKNFGSQHSRTGLSLSKLGELYEAQSDYTQAEPLLKEALGVMEQTLGSEHPYVATALNSLAMLYHAQGEYIQAESLYRRALSIREQALGPEHLFIIKILEPYGNLLETVGREDEASELEMRIQSIRAMGVGVASEKPL